MTSGDLDVVDAYLADEPGDPPDLGQGCFHGRCGIARLALDRDGGLTLLVPACHRPDQRMYAGKRYRVWNAHRRWLVSGGYNAAITRTELVRA
jgi:hypothetical protein